MQSQVTTATESRTTPPLFRFSLGNIFATTGAMDAMSDANQTAQEFINHHARLEQGELSNEDHRENLFSVSRPLRIFTSYKTALGVKLWVITEADRSATTILLPSEY
jgi:hypothetical protein